MTMIGHIRGTLLYKQAPQLLVDVQGVGYEIVAPMTTFYHLPEIGCGGQFVYPFKYT